jgi:murein DD-endopeptidase MepM/ murein hydrolase activator NlpD
MIKCLLLLLPILLLAQPPQAYKQLGEAIEREIPFFKTLSLDPRFNIYQEEFDLYFEEQKKAFKLGYKLDAEIEEVGERRERLKKSYYKEVQAAIEEKDNDYFLFLLENAEMFLDENRILKSRVLSYATSKNELKDHKRVQAYQEEKELDDRSYAFAQKMQEEYKAYQEVLRKQEALKLRKLLVSKKKGGVIVYAQEDKGNINFITENLFEMHVSTTLHIKDIQGYRSKDTLPYKLVLKPKEKRKVLSLENISKKKEVGYFNSHISWTKGAVDAQIDLDFIYALPFHKSHKVSQGFNGNTSHKGTSKYAVDFAMPVGTAVYAARGGKVVEVVQRHDQHGMSLKMRQFANYVIIEHEDKTLGRYFHLKHKGVKVKLGQVVKKGELIALSGNTGRTSGAHLHFVVTKAEEYKEGYRSTSIPIKFKCTEGVVDNPLKGYSYCYVK